MRHRLLDLLARLATGHALLVTLVAVVLTVLALGEARNLTLKTGQMDLTPAGNPVRRQFKDFLEDFQVLDDVFLLVTYRDEKQAKDFAERLALELPSTGQVREVFTHLDLETITRKFLYLLEPERLDRLLKALSTQAPTMTTLSKAQELRTLLNLIEEQSRPDPTGRKPDLERVTADLGVVLAVLRAMTRHVSRPGEGDRSFWRSLFLDNGDEPERIYDEEGYIISRQARRLLLIVKSSRALSSQEDVVAYFTAVRSVVERIQAEYDGISVGYAGSPAVTFDEKGTVESDMLFSTLLSLTGITLLFILSLQSIIHPLLGVSTLVTSLLWTFGITGVTVGHLTLVSSTFTATLIGLGIGFGIHVVACYEEERARGHDNDEAIACTLRETGPGLITGATTSAAAFYTMLLTDFTAFQELGFIAGTGLLVALLNMLVLLPALLTLKTRFLPTHRGALGGFLSDAIPSEDARPVLAAMSRLCRSHPLLVSALFAIVVAGCLPMALAIRFDYNLLNLQASSSPAVLNEQELVSDFGISPEFNAVIVPDLATAHTVTARLRTLTSVARVESVADLIPADTEDRRTRVEPYRHLVDDFETRRRHVPPPDPDEITAILTTIGNRMRALRVYAFLQGNHRLVMLSTELERDITNWRLAFECLPYEIAMDRLARFQRQLFGDLLQDLSQLKEAFTETPYTVATLPRELRDRFLGRSGSFVIYLFPSIDVRQEANAKRFIRDTAEVWPTFTGLPVIKDEMVGLIRQGFYRASLYALAALALMVYLDFRRSAHSLIVLGALLSGTVLMLAGMFLTGLKFNPANFVALPIILGIGVDNGVHIMQRFLGGSSLDVVLLRTGRAITLNSLTTAIGFGSLALSSYQGFATLGFIMVVGVGACYATAVLLQPALMYVTMIHPRTVREQLGELLGRLLAFRP